jgi:two-component system, sensor histidine kinase and response regulator
MGVRIAALLSSVGPWFRARRRRLAGGHKGLLESEARYRSLFQEAPVAYHEIDRNGIVQRVNRAECELLGFDRAQMVGSPIWDFLAPEVRETSRRAFARKLTGEQALAPFQREYLRGDGSQVIVEIHDRLIRDAQGNVTGIRSALLDVTARRRAEQALEEAEAGYRSLFETIPIGVYRTTPDGRVLMANPALVKMLGYSSFEDLATYNLEQEGFEPRYDRREFRAAFEGGGEVKGREAVWRRRDGTSIAVRENARAIRADDGTMRYFEGTVEDITEGKRAEQALEQANSLLEAVIRASPLAIIAIDREGITQSWNPAAERVFGWTQEEVLGRALPVVHRDDAEGYREYMDAVNSGQAFGGLEKRALRKDGSELDVSIWSAPLRDSQGKITGSVALSADITQRKRDEQKLCESEERYRDVFENSHDIIFSIDLDGNFTSLNKAAEQATGYSRAEGLRMNVDQVTAPRDRARVRELIALKLAGGTATTEEVTILTKDGREVMLEIRPRLVFDKGRPVGIQSVGRDVTERKRHQEELARHTRELQRKNEELLEALTAAHAAAEAKNCFLANMSHEVRTPMNGIVGMIDLLMSTPLGREQREYAETIQMSAAALLAVISDVLEFSRIEAGKLELETAPFELAPVLGAVCALLRLRARQKQLQLSFSVDAALPRMVRGDASRVRQVMTSLIGNAIKFTEQGEVAVRMALESEAGEIVTIRVTVRDTGIGIAAERCAPLFKGFEQGDNSATRKYGGAGLGLAISKQLVEMMGGQIGVESELGRGSTFWFTVQLRKQIEPATPAPPDLFAPAASVPPAGVRILLAEDNEVNRRIALRMLEKCGFQAEAVCDGRQAADAVLGGHYDVVLMDVHMPMMDGLAATAEIRGREGNGRHTPIVAMTARALAGDREECLSAGMDDYIAKPVQMEELRQAIQRWAGSDGAAKP